MAQIGALIASGWTLGRWLSLWRGWGRSVVLLVRIVVVPRLIFGLAADSSFLTSIGVEDSSAHSGHHLRDTDSGALVGPKLGSLGPRAVVVVVVAVARLLVLVNSLGDAAPPVSRALDIAVNLVT